MVNSEPAREIGEVHSSQKWKSEKRLIRLVGLDIKALEGKTILNLGAGETRLKDYLSATNINSTVISYDKDLSVAYINKPKHVAGDMQEGLPFKEEFFDEIIDIGGPLQCGPLIAQSLQHYRDREALRALKVNGEIRVFNPFNGIGGISAYLYQLEKDGKFQIDEEIMKNFPYEEIPEFDERERPLPFFPGDDFWLAQCYALPVDQQRQISQELARITEEFLLVEGENIEVTIQDSFVTPVDYNSYMVIKKLSQSHVKEVENIS